MKRIITILVFISFLLTPILTTAYDNETDGQKTVREAGLSVKWIDPGFEFESTTFANPDWHYRKDMLAVKAEKKDGSYSYGFVNEKGDLAIPFTYVEALDFNDGFAVVWLGYDENDNGRTAVVVERRILIDMNGAEVLDLSEYLYASHYDGLVWVSKDRKSGVIDIKGNVILPCEYDYIQLLENGLIWARDTSNYTYGLFDRSGKSITKMEYDFISHSDGDNHIPFL